MQNPSDPPSQPISPSAIPSPQIAYPPSPQYLKSTQSSSFTRKTLALIIFGIFILIIIASTFAFFSLNNFKAQRLILFRLIYSHINSNEAIPSILKLDNPRILNFGTSYTLEGKITHITPLNTDQSEVMIKTDIEDLPELRIDNKIQVVTGWGNDPKSASVRNIKSNQSIKIVVAYSVTDAQWYPSRLYIEE